MPTIVMKDVVEPADLAVIGGGLNQFNDETLGFSDREPLSVIVQDPETGETIGGATGRTSVGLMFLDLFYLPARLRGTGIGTEVLRQFEAEGRRRGCRSGVLFTASFHAPGFYERNGWRRFGEIPSAPGTSRIYMTKDFSTEAEQP